MSYKALDIANKIIANTDAEKGELISNLRVCSETILVKGGSK